MPIKKILKTRKLQRLSLLKNNIFLYKLNKKQSFNKIKIKKTKTIFQFKFLLKFLLKLKIKKYLKLRKLKRLRKLKLKLRIKKKLKLIRRINLKIHFILLRKDLSGYKRKINIIKNKTIKKRPIKIIKHLNFKYRVKERKNEILRKNRFIKRNKKWENTRKPHFLVLRTSESNSHMNLTDSKGNTKFVCSCGTLGFKGSKRSSKYAIERLTIEVVNKLRKYRLLNIMLKIKGYSKRHKIVFKLFMKMKRRFKGITGISVAHNGCRLKKVRRN